MKSLELPIPPDLRPIMHYYEKWCVMGCCGLDALDLSPQFAVQGMMDHGLAWAERGLAALETLIPTVLSHTGVVHSGQDDFCYEWKSGNEAAAFLTDLHASLSKAIQHVRTNGLTDSP